jgi:hypothetical protein
VHCKSSGPILAQYCTSYILLICTGLVHYFSCFSNFLFHYSVSVALYFKSSIHLASKIDEVKYDLPID